MKLYVLVLLALILCGVAAGNETENVDRINRAIEVSDIGWVAGVTSVSGLSAEEKQKLSAPVGVREPGASKFMAGERSLRYEETFDWRDTEMVSPVRMQGSCGSCWAFGTVAAVESALRIYAGVWADLSEQHLVSDCTRTGDCGGGWPNWALDYVRDVGLPVEGCQPYVAHNTVCDPCDGWKENAYRISEYMYVEPEDFRAALTAHGPLVCVLSVPDDWYYYREGVYEPVQRLGWANHVVLLVGWDDEDGCWIIKNSWGERWGEDGYARVKYGVLEAYEYAYVITGVVIGAEKVVDGWVKPWTAESSSNHSKRYRAEMAIDNRSNTHWFSDSKDRSPWISFAMMEPSWVSGARVEVFHRDLPMTVTIETSGTGDVWEEAAVCRVENVSSVIEFPARVCRYVRMVQEDYRRAWGTCAEFDVWVVAEPDPKPVVPESLIMVGYENRTEVFSVDSGVLRNVSLVVDGCLAFEWRNI